MGLMSNMYTDKQKYIKELMKYSDFHLDDDAYYQKVLEDAFSNHDGMAFFCLAKIYIHGDYVNQDCEKAIKYLKFAHEYSDGVIDSSWLMKFLSLFRRGVKEKDEWKDCYIDFLKYLIGKDDYNAAFLLALEYDGELLPKNIQKKLELLNLAKDHNVKKAYDQLGEMYFLGEEVKQDYEMAYNYLTHDVPEESNIKNFYLGEMFRLGIYVEKDITKAKEYYIKVEEFTQNFWEYEVCEKANTRLKLLGK